MNYYKARQRNDKRWDYTCMNDGVIWPVGYCEESHTDGHDTPEEARTCYGKYLLDQDLILGEHYDNTQHICKVCQSWTNMYASVSVHGMNIQHFNLCEKHNNREEVEKLFSAPAEIWSS